MTIPIEIGAAGGEYMEDVVVIEWAIGEGDPVRQGDLLVVVETAKAATAVESPVDGILSKISVPVGSEVPVNEVLGWIDDKTVGDSNSADAERPGDNDTEPDLEPAAVEVADDSTVTMANPTPDANCLDTANGRIIASPAARRVAMKNKIKLTELVASSPTGRIKLRDVESAMASHSSTGSTEQPAKSTESSASPTVTAETANLGTPPIPEVDFSRFGEVERVEMSRIRLKTAANLHRAWLSIPMVTHHDEADITDLEAFRHELNSQETDTDTKMTALAFHVRALVEALKQFPRFNASLATSGQAIIYKKYFHIAIAVDTPEGLLVPVIRDVDRKSLRVLAAEIADLGVRARAKQLNASEMTGACMTISSLGGIGGTAFTPIVNPPEVAILGITRAKMKPEWDGSEFVPRLMCPLDLTYDHRVLDGADAARFMAFYLQAIEDIRRLML